MIESRLLGKREEALKGWIRKAFNIWSEKTGSEKDLGLQPLGCWKRKIGKLQIGRLRVGREETLVYKWADIFSVESNFSVLLPLPICHGE